MATSKAKMTAAEYMASKQPGNPGFAETMTPGAAGTDKPTQGDGATNGFAGKGESAPHGQTTKAKSAEGKGGKKKELHPNSDKKAGTMLKGKGFPGGNHKAAAARRLGQAGPPATGKPGSRSGILAHFEGFGTPQDSSPPAAK